ncbi:MAG TPA: SIS domain-containing protein [Ensifer sp.]|nr:SIS domain-containing protein [Ensifer sp.]
MTTTHMRQEIDEIPDAVARLLESSGSALADAGRALRNAKPAFVATIARGSSDHASLFLKYATELVAGRAVASLGPSLASIYGATLDLKQAAVFAVSQSGRSPDIVSMLQSAARSGALTLTLTNAAGSPLWDAADVRIDIAAGPELAVAATKSYVNSAVAGLAVLAHWANDDALVTALEALPSHLRDARALDWSALTPVLEQAGSLYVLGRGPALAIASEAALKFKETSDMHAEAYSSAEVMHGPVALVSPGFPVLVLAARDAAERSAVDAADALAAKGAAAFVTSKLAERAHRLPFIETGHPLTDALSLIVPFYGFAEDLSRRRGYDPDQPVALKKVTETQ